MSIQEYCNKVIENANDQLKYLNNNECRRAFLKGRIDTLEKLLEAMNNNEIL